MYKRQPLAGDSTQGNVGEFVYAGATGLYYHSNANCPQLGSDTPQYVSLEIAERRGLEACPTCYNPVSYTHLIRALGSPRTRRA